MSMLETSESNAAAQESHWIPLSDLMTGLMVMFLLIAVIYMLRVEDDRKKITEVAIAYSAIRDALYEELEDEFKEDLPKWKAELIPESLTIRFKEPEVLFATGSSEIKPEFAAILEDFFPRYVNILSSEKFRASISEVRIEGHTSSEWATHVAPEQAYLLNMELSQSRTRSALGFVLNLPKVAANGSWLQKLLTANGLSSSQLVLDENHQEDPQRSRRVDFRVRTDAETKLAKILEISE